jgi:hypothetical protein
MGLKFLFKSDLAEILASFCSIDHTGVDIAFKTFSWLRKRRKRRKQALITKNLPNSSHYIITSFGLSLTLSRGKWVREKFLFNGFSSQLLLFLLSSFLRLLYLALKVLFQPLKACFFAFFIAFFPFLLLTKNR